MSQSMAVTVLNVYILAVSMILLGGPSHGQQRAGHCPSHCRCLDKASVQECTGADLLFVPMLVPTALMLDLDHNNIHFLRNNSFNQASRLEIISLENNGIVHMDAATFQPLPELRILRLGNNHISYLPRDIFWNNRQIEVLDLHLNAFISIPDHAVMHLHALTVFNMSYNHLTSPHLGPGFKLTTQLSSLDLSGNNFLSLEAHVFQATLWWDENMKHHLNLSYCNIRHIHPKALSKLYRLEALSLEGNPEIPQSDLKAAMEDLEMNVTNVFGFMRRFQHKNLLELNLSHNGVKYLKKGTFFYLVNLRFLDLSHNRMSTIGDLNGLARLEHLTLAFNFITSLNKNQFEGMDHLRTLDLSHNSLTTIDGEPLQELFNLRALDISCNQLETIAIAHGLENLETLLAGSNKLTNLGFVKRLMRLKVLDFSRNHVVRVSRDVFSRGQTLKIINLSHNSLRSLDRHAFRGSTQEHLDLSYNRLQRLQHPGWRALRTLHLQGNQLVNVSVDALRGLRALQELSLADNRLRALPQGLLIEQTQLRSLTLSDNPGLGRYLAGPRAVTSLSHLQRLERLLLGGVGLQSLPAGMLRGMTLLRRLDLSRNLLTDEALTTQTFTHNQRLEWLNASSNKLQVPNSEVFRDARSLRTVDLSHQPYLCTCALMPFRNWLLSSAGNVTVASLHRQGAYVCVRPVEWARVQLTDFWLESANSCEHQERTVIFVGVSCALLALLLLVCAGTYRYQWWMRKKLHRTRYSAIRESADQCYHRHEREWV